MGLLFWRAVHPVGSSGRESQPPTDEIPRYPPFPSGLPAAPVERVLGTQSQLIAELQDALAFTDARFAELVAPVLPRYAGFVHLLPASEAHHHRGAGGLFRHGLEVAFWSARAAQGLVLATDRTPAERRALEPRWRLGAGLAGLCHDLGKPVSDLQVVSAIGDSTWQPFREDLVAWATRASVGRYFLRWRERAHGAHVPLALLALPRVLPSETLAWLADPDPAVLHALLHAVSGQGEAETLGRLVTAADRASVERDLREHRLEASAGLLAVPVERHLVDAMRRLLGSGRWTVNRPGARVWVLEGGVHLVWRAAAPDLTELLYADGIAGVPRDPDTLADVLLERGLALPCPVNGQRHRYWRAAPETLARGGGEITLYLLRLAEPGLLFTGVVPPAVPARFLDAPNGEAQAAPGSAAEPRALPSSAAAAAPPTAATSSLTRSPESNRAAVDSVPEEQVRHPAQARSGAVKTPGPGEPEPPANDPWLARLAERWQADGGGAGTHLRLQSDRLVVDYPAGLAEFREPSATVLRHLLASGAVEPDPAAPLRPVRTVDGARVIVLTAEATRCVCGPTESASVAPDHSNPAEPATPATARRANFVRSRRRATTGRDPGQAPSEPADSRVEDPDALARLAEAFVAAARAAATHRVPGVEVTPHWVRVEPSVLTALLPPGPEASPFRLTRAIAEHPACELAADGRIAVRRA